jgi:hypothetical protein
MSDDALASASVHETSNTYLVRGCSMQPHGTYLEQGSLLTWVSDWSLALFPKVAGRKASISAPVQEGAATAGLPDFAERHHGKWRCEMKFTVVLKMSLAVGNFTADRQ